MSSVPKRQFEGQEEPGSRKNARHSPTLHQLQCASVFQQVKEDLNRQFADYLRETRESPEYRALPEGVQKRTLLNLPMAEYRRTMCAFRDLYQHEPCSLLTFGSNDSNELGAREKGLVHPKTSLFPRPVRGLDSIVSYAAADQHHLAILRDGTVWSWGTSDFGRLGRSLDGGDTDDMERTPAQIQGFCAPGGQQADASIVKAAGGDCSSLFLSIHGDVYCCGAFVDDNNKTWYVPRTPNDSLRTRQTVEPQHIPLPGKAKDIACGKGHAIVLLEDDRLYSFGLKVEGVGSALGRAGDVAFDTDERRRNVFLVPHPMQWAPNTPANTVLSVACGPLTTFVVARSRDSPGTAVYACGINSFGQLGLGHKNSVDVLTKSETSVGKNIVEVSLGETHSLALDIFRRHLYGCGNANDGRLGMFDDDVKGQAVLTWQPVPFPDREIEFTSFACGSQHCMASTTNNELYTWGFGEAGQLGHGYTVLAKGQKPGEVNNSEQRPRPVDVTREIADNNIIIHKVFGGGHFSSILFSKK